MKQRIALLVIALAILACGTTTPDPPQTPASPTAAPIIEAEEAIPTPLQTYTVCTDTLRVRGCPSTSCSELRYLKENATVRVREWSHNGNGWAMIEPAEWVNGDYLCHR